MIDKNVFEFEIFSTRQYSAIVLEKQEKEESRKWYTWVIKIRIFGKDFTY